MEKRRENIGIRRFFRYCSTFQGTGFTLAGKDFNHQNIRKRRRRRKFPGKCGGNSRIHAKFRSETESAKNRVSRLFHVLSRKNPEWRDKLYQVIGFYKCKEIEFPPKFASRKITNPDAPINDHCIKLKLGKDSVWAIPILVSKSEKYDLAQGGELLSYISLGFPVLSKDKSAVLKNVTYDKNNLQIVGVNDVKDFYEQVGKNHPIHYSPRRNSGR